MTTVARGQTAVTKAAWLMWGWVKHGSHRVPIHKEVPTVGVPSRTQHRTVGEAGQGPCGLPRAEQKPHLGLSPRRDAQRVEELCAKNHQLRAQQKALKDNVRVLENR